MENSLDKSNPPKIKEAHLLLSGDKIFWTFQGEGPSIGRPAIFIRLHMCNLECDWSKSGIDGSICDAFYTWDKTSKEYWTEHVSWSFDKVYEEILKYPCHRIVVTGGEPLLQQVQLSSFIENIRFLENGYTIEIETNGTIAISQEFLLDIAHNNRLQINCSPKLSSSDNLFSSCIKPSVLQQLNTFPGTCFKFVIRDESDFNEVYDIVSSCRLDHDKIILMPEGTDPEILKNRSFWIVEKAKKLDWRFTMRLQCELYGNKRGV